ncbi:hypothetical protein C8J57DRAFT_1404847 [Mycena rebaudengoi]|nr:hypothetical protein C8J57DRAFT_1404847 [Mycena rebaudengoi]
MSAFSIVAAGKKNLKKPSPHFEQPPTAAFTSRPLEPGDLESIFLALSGKHTAGTGTHTFVNTLKNLLTSEANLIAQAAIVTAHQSNVLFAEANKLAPPEEPQYAILKAVVSDLLLTSFKELKPVGGDIDWEDELEKGIWQVASMLDHSVGGHHDNQRASNASDLSERSLKSNTSANSVPRAMGTVPALPAHLTTSSKPSSTGSQKAPKPVSKSGSDSFRMPSVPDANPSSKLNVAPTNAARFPDGAGDRSGSSWASSSSLSSYPTFK